MAYTLKLGPENRSANALNFLVVSASDSVCELVHKAAVSMNACANLAPEICAAEEFLRRRKLDAVIVDFDLEGAGRFLAWIRTGNANRMAPIFACLSSQTQRQYALTSGANFLLQKPLSVEGVRHVFGSAHDMMLRERRRYFRHPVYLHIAVGCENQEHRFTTLNLSEGGAAIRGHHLLDSGTLVTFRFVLLTEHDIAGQGEIVWSNEEGAMGIRFHNMKEDCKMFLVRWLEEQERLSGTAKS